MDKIWIGADENRVCANDINIDADRLSAETGVSRLTAKVLIKRGCIDAGKVEMFLNPSLSDLHDPFLLNDMAPAVERILAAVLSQERIVIYGDYDADGITATALLYQFLKNELNGNVGCYIPDRLIEGYGLSKTGLDKLAQAGTSLVITVDCGVSALEEALYARELGMEMVITDHHQCQGVLPAVCAVINPCRPDSTYPFKDLAGVGVAFKLTQALCIKTQKGGKYLNYLDLATLGTVADMVSLTGENRTIVKHGLKAIEKTSNIGLKSLLQICSLESRELTTTNLAFGLAPRINAAGRTGSAIRALELLTTPNVSKAVSLSRLLDEENKKRQYDEKLIMEQAISAIDALHKTDKKVLVVAGHGWQQGIVGIAASKLSEKYYRPTFLISLENGIGKGSARSIEGFNLFKALISCSHLLKRFGGHEKAAGFTLEESNIPELERMINEFADLVLTEQDMVPHLRIDTEVEANEISLSNATELEKLAPFGIGNPAPLFMCREMNVLKASLVGSDKHLKLSLSAGNVEIDAIGFNMAAMTPLKGQVDTVFTIEVNKWNARAQVQMNLRDLRRH